MDIEWQAFVGCRRKRHHREHPHDGKNWRREASGTENFLHSIVGTSDNKRLWAAGSNGTILESDDGEHWKSCAKYTSADLESIYASSDAKHLWAVGDRATILASDDGEYWSSQTSGTQNDLHSVYGTMDGKQVWAVGMRGTILESGRVMASPTPRAAALKVIFGRFLVQKEESGFGFSAPKVNFSPPMMMTIGIAPASVPRSTSLQSLYLIPVPSGS